MSEDTKLGNYFTKATYYMFSYWKIVTILFLCYLFWNTYEDRLMRIAVEENTKAIRESAKYAIKTNNRNQIRGFEQEKIQDKDYKFVIAGYIERYLVKSSYDLTARSGKKYFATYNELFKNQKGIGGLNEFYYNFIYAPNNESNPKSEKILEYEKKAQADFVKFLNKLAINLRDKQIPQIKDTLGVNESDIIYVYKGNEFSIELKVHQRTAGVTKEGIAYKNIPQKAWFKLTGYIDEENTHPIINPLGIRFKSLEARPTLHPQKALNAMKLKQDQEKRKKAKEQRINEQRKY